jgi:hypothetical protein
MGLSEFLLIPFRRAFRPPVLNTPFSTIKMPSVVLTLPICGISFFIITSGFVYCFVTGMPMVGYSRDESQRIVASWISPNGLSSQFLAEGIIAAMTFTLGAASLIVAFYEVMKPEKDKSEFDRFLTYFAYSAPFWQFAALQVFRMKIPAYFPTFRKLTNH